MSTAAIEEQPPTPTSGGNADMKQAASKAGEVVAAWQLSQLPLEKLVIAIHGIGDQTQFETVQSVVTRFGEHLDFPAAVPLGSFHSSEGQVRAFRLKAPPSVPEELGTIGFVEVYWADIPRGLQQKGFTIEETKAWAKTVVQRVRARYGQEFKDDLKMGGTDFAQAGIVLEEMIDTIRVLGNLTHLAEKAGLARFDLDNLLTNFLGDVQLVADFEDCRKAIRDQFRSVIDGIWPSLTADGGEGPEIYLVAHSEGTVVSFMGLLEAMAAQTKGEDAPPTRAAWIDRVRGFMTIGSPMDKHIVLWPEMWKYLYTPGMMPKQPIQWKNYYDHGDPIGFELDTTRDWLKDHGWMDAFAFTEADDMGFTRYVLPGAAHNEYWGDKAVFGHFLQNVMGLDPKNTTKNYKSPPSTRWAAAIGSYILPYLIAFGLLYGGTYLLFKAMAVYLDTTEPDLPEFISNVAGATFLLAGLTIAVRIPRLTRVPGWRVFGWILFLTCGGIYSLCVEEILQSNLAFNLSAPTAVTIGLAAAVGVIASILSSLKGLPDALSPYFRGLRPLLLPGGLAIAAIVAFRLHKDGVEGKPLWQLFLAGAAFFYLWWLAALLFDLVFVWHRYIRNSALDARLRRYRPLRKQREATESAVLFKPDPTKPNLQPANKV